MADVWIADAGVFEQKMATFRLVGAEGICVVSDWDRTLTQPKMANGQDTTSYLAIVHGGYLGDAYRDEMARLYVKYRGVELATDISEADKLRSMDAWWMAAFELLRGFGLTREMILDVGAREMMVLREQVDVFFRLLDQMQVPLHIVSAGLGDVITAFLDARALHFVHLDVIANWMRFGEKGEVVGFSEPVIHSANKTQLVDRERLGDRVCVLLLGDTLEDAEMVKDFEGGTVIRVGFLNGDTEPMYDAFANVFDVVVGTDGRFDCVNDMVNNWLGSVIQ
jgi:HAD superfamily hydrolase (TIGR01544 family)